MLIGVEIFLTVSVRVFDKTVRDKEDLFHIRNCYVYGISLIRIMSSDN